MSTTYTSNLGLGQPATADRNWGTVINADTSLLDVNNALANLMVRVHETPSTTLNVAVNAGTYQKADGTVGTYGGTSSYTLTASTTTYLWLTDGGSLTAGGSYPTSAHVRLAHVVTGSGTVTTIVDDRMGPATCGTGLGFVLKTGDTMTGTLAVVSPSSAVSAFTVNPSTPAVGFFGVTLVGQQTGGSATAGATWTATEKNMLNAAYSALRAYGLLT